MRPLHINVLEVNEDILQNIICVCFTQNFLGVNEGVLQNMTCTTSHKSYSTIAPESAECTSFAYFFR